MKKERGGAEPTDNSENKSLSHDYIGSNIAKAYQEKKAADDLSRNTEQEEREIFPVEMKRCFAFLRRNHNVVVAAAAIGTFVVTAIYAGFAFLQWLAITTTNQQTGKDFEIGQRSYIALGRKDGVIAEFKQVSEPSGWPTLTLYLQNAGRLPASTVCVQATISAWPIDPAQHYEGGPLIRQIGKDGQGDMQTVESGCPTIGGDSVYPFVLSRFFQQSVLNRVLADPRSDIRLSATIQQCDSFGHYSCKSVGIPIERETLSPYRITELDCTQNYGQVPTLVYGTPVTSTAYGTNDPLPPCLGDDSNVQEKQLKFVKDWVAFLRNKETLRKQSSQGNGHQ